MILLLLNVSTVVEIASGERLAKDEVSGGGQSIPRGQHGRSTTRPDDTP
jgi:hypothetical protein